MAMADGYGLFWNSNSGDRKYDAQSFEKWLKKFFTSGVFEGDLQVLASSGMTVQVQTGYSNVNGKVGLFESATNVTLSAANSRYPRIDTIIIERNDVDRVIQIDKVTGAYTGENPQPTAPIWDETQGIYQLVLAQIYVGAGVSSISQEDITDKRTDTDVCGYIAGTVNEMDFSQFTAQFEAYFSTFESTQLAEFEEWFDHMKDQLDSDAAGHLQAEVDEINGIIAPVQLTLTASQPYAIGEQFIYDGKLYTATSAIAENDTIVIGTNADLSAEIVKQIKSAKDSIGTLSSLDTTVKTDLVSAVNEVDEHADANTVAIAKTQSILAPVLTSLVAPTGGLSTGQQFIYNGLLYKATANISASSTIVIGGNAELADCVTEQIENLNTDVTRRIKRFVTTVSGVTSSKKLKITRNSPTDVYFVILRGTNGWSHYSALISGYDGGVSRNSVIELAKGTYITSAEFKTSDNSDRTFEISFSDSISTRITIVICSLYSDASEYTVTLV